MKKRISITTTRRILGLSRATLHRRTQLNIEGFPKQYVDDFDRRRRYFYEEEVLAYKNKLEQEKIY